MKDAFDREIVVGDYVVKLTPTKSYDNKCIFRIFGFDNDKKKVYVVDWEEFRISHGWDHDYIQEWNLACENPKEYYNKNKGFLGPKCVEANEIVKTYPPVWERKQ